MDAVNLKKPTKYDAKSIYNLVKNSPPLDINSLYSYAMVGEYFSHTSALCTNNNDVIGFISAFKSTKERHRLFVWQVAVDVRARGKKLATKMLDFIIRNNPEITEIETTINPSNKASFRLFESFVETKGGGLVDESIFLDESSFEEAHESEVKYIFSIKK